MKRVDRRTKYTKFVIKQSMLTILKNKPLRKITVTEICSLADINRSTFYSHYNDPYDLFNSITDDFIESIQKAITSKNVILDFLIAIKNNLEISKIIFGPNGDHNFINKIEPFAREKFLYYLTKENSVNKEKIDYYYSFIKGGIGLIINEWIQNDCQETPQTVRNNILDILNKLKNN